MKIFLGNWEGPMATLAFDPQGNPAIAYYYAFRGLKYAHYRGGRWRKVWVGKPGLTYTYPHCLALSFATKGPHQGQPRIFFRKLHELIYATSADGRSWQTKLLLNTRKGKRDKYLTPSLALDPYGNPALAYLDRDTQTVWVRFKHGGRDRSFEISARGEYPQHPALAFDLQGNPALIYLDRRDNVLKFTRFTGTKWQAVKTVDMKYRSIVKGKNIANISLAFSRLSNNPAIAFNDGRRVKFATLFKGKWQAQTIAQKGQCIALAFDPNGRPTVAYYGLKKGGSKAQELRYAYMADLNWHTEVVTPGSEFALPTFSLNTKGNPVISFYDPHKDELRVASQVTYTAGYKPKPAPAPRLPVISGVVRDALTGKPIQGAKIKTDYMFKLGATTDAQGKYGVPIEKFPKLFKGIRIYKANYHPRWVPLDFASKDWQKAWTLNVLLHPQANWHDTIKVNLDHLSELPLPAVKDSKFYLPGVKDSPKPEEKFYQVTFVEKDTTNPQKKEMKARIFFLERNDTVLEDKEIDLKSLPTEKQKIILLPAHLWVFLKYPLSQDVTGYDYLRKVSKLNRYYLKAAVKDYKDKQQKAEIKKKVTFIVKGLQNLDTASSMVLAISTGAGAVAKEVLSNVLGSMFIDPVFGAMGGIASDELLGKDIEKYPEQRQKAVINFYSADNYLLTTNNKLYSKALNCIPDPPRSAYFTADGRDNPYVMPKPLKLLPPNLDVLKSCEKFLDDKDSRMALQIKHYVSSALDNMVKGFTFMEKVPSTFEGKEGWWSYERDLSEKLNYSIKLRIPKNTIAIKVYSNVDPVFKYDRTTAELKLATEYDRKYEQQVSPTKDNPLVAGPRLEPLKSILYFSKTVKFDLKSLAPANSVTDITSTDNSSKKQGHASLIFNKPLPCQCTMTFKLGENQAIGELVAGSIKANRSSVVFINYLISKTKALEALEKPIKSFKAQIDKLGEKNSIIIQEK